MPNTAFHRATSWKDNCWTDARGDRMSKNCKFEESSIYDYEALKGFMAVGP